jgi:hypothetical protein
MELLKLLIIIGSFIYLPIWNFFEFFIILFFLNKIYKLNNVTHLASWDPMNVVIGCVNIILHVIVYDLKLLVNYCENTRLIKSYNYLNNKYLSWRLRIIFKMMGFAMSKYSNNFIPGVNKLVRAVVKEPIDLPDPIVSLRTDTEITSFLDDILVTNNH